MFKRMYTKPKEEERLTTEIKIITAHNRYAINCRAFNREGPPSVSLWDIIWLNCYVILLSSHFRSQTPENFVVLDVDETRYRCHFFFSENRRGTHDGASGSNGLLAIRLMTAIRNIIIS